MRRLHYWEPQEKRCDEHSRKFSLGLSTSRKKATLLKVLLADYWQGPSTGVINNVETCTQTTKILFPNYSVRLSISPVLLNTKGNHIVWMNNCLQKVNCRSKQSLSGG